MSEKVVYIEDCEVMSVDDIAASITEEIERLPFTNGQAVVYPVDTKRVNKDSVEIELSNGEIFIISLKKKN